MDGVINLANMTREQLIELLNERNEDGVNIQFVGKANARRLARKVRPRVQRSIKRYSAGDAEAQSRNLVVEGDNLQSMVTLYRERGQVDLILTDPPYNTGEDFRYNDRWDLDPNDPGLGELVTEDEVARHTKWMRFMLPRLRMMKSMLKPTGVLAICIDHRELFHLGQMLDELFGDKNRLAIINWEKSYAPRNDNKHVSTSTEYVLVYARDVNRAKTELLERTEQNNSRYTNVDNDSKGLWREHDAAAATPQESQQFGVQSPFSGQMYYPPGSSSWRHPKRNMRTWLEEWGPKYEEREIGDGRAKALMVFGGQPGKIPVAAAKKAEKRLAQGDWPFIWFGLKGTGGPRVKRYLDQVKKGVVPMTYWADDDYSVPLEIGCTSWDHEESGRSQTGIKELNAIVGSGHGFETVKPLQLFQKIIQLWCPSDGLVLDPFGGSGTTGHAVLAINSVAQTNRRFIMVEQGRPENGDSYARTLLADRLARAVSGDWANGKGLPLPGGFRFVHLDRKVDADALLAMEREEMVDTVIASYFDNSKKRGSTLVPDDPDAHRFLVAHNSEQEGFFLIWEGPDRNTDFNEDVYEECSKEAARAGLKPKYHVYARYNLYQTETVRFYQIPDRILIDFGLDLRSDAFADDEASEDRS